MHPLVKGFFTQGTIFISICYILSLSYANIDDEGKYFVYATTVSDDDSVQDLDEESEVILKPIIRNNPGLKVEEVSDGLDFPTSMAFLGPDDILVLEKNEGNVRRIINGVMLERPLLKVDVATEGERGMLGIAIAQEEVAAIEGNDDEGNGMQKQEDILVKKLTWLNLDLIADG